MVSPGNTGRLKRTDNDLSRSGAPSAKVGSVGGGLRGSGSVGVGCGVTLYRRHRHGQPVGAVAGLLIVVVDRACILAAFYAAAEVKNSPRFSINAHASTLARDPHFPRFLD